METTPSLFPLTLDTRVADTTVPTRFDIRPLTGRFGPDCTWRDILKADHRELEALPGFGPRTADAVFRFISENIPFSFQDYLESF